jgi:uncharacterized protein involved in exopolysaccharide biosynthesis
MSKSKVHVLDYLQQVVKWRNFIIINFIIVCIIVAGISLIIPKTYRAYAVILPSQDTGSVFSPTSLLEDIPSSIAGFDLGLGNMNSDVASYLAILSSRSIMDSLITEFNLLEEFKVETMIDARKILSTMVSHGLSDEGTISLSVAAKTDYFSFGDEDRTAKVQAKKMTQYYLDQMIRIKKKLQSEQARQYRLFIEERYKQNLSDLEEVENKLNTFQNEHGTISLPDQTTAAIDVIAKLRSIIVSKEVEADVLRSYVDSSHPDLLKINRELQELREKYNEFINRKKPDGKKDVFLSIEDLPDLALQHARLLRDVKIQMKIQETLLPLYEQAKIQEAKNTPVVQVIDPPVLPEKKEKPKRAIIVILAGLASIFFSLVGVIIIVNFDNWKIHNRDKYKRFETIVLDFISLKKTPNKKA